MSSDPKIPRPDGGLSGTVHLSPVPPSADLQGTVDHPTGGRPVRPDRPAALSGTQPMPDGPEGGPTHDVTGEYDPASQGGTLSVTAPSGSDGVPTTAGGPAERYRFDRFHARGGMGEIWVATDQSIGRAVAVKKMRPGMAAGHQQAFLVEARITGQLEHPGVVPVHELGRGEDGQPYYVMKFVHGRTLEKVIAEHHSSAVDSGEREVSRVRLLQTFISLCQTVGYAHSRKVIHRDLKPDNVMIGPYGETLVLDWGLAKVVGEAEPGTEGAPISASPSGESYQTAFGTIKGTPGYMSPEAAEGDVSRVDEVSDIYLLGATLYQILTGRRPRKADKLKDLIRMAQKEPPVPPRRIDPSVPRPLEAVCLKAMAMRKEDRYPTATALGEDVERFLAGEPVTAYRESMAERAWRWVRRHRLAIARTLAAFGVLALVGMGLDQWRRIEREREEERRAFQADLDRKDRETRAAQEEADRLAARKRAVEQAATFRALADEARYFAANADPVAEQAPFFDPERGLALARKALAVADGWGPGLEDFPVADERPGLRDDLADLLLLMVQVRGRQPDPAGSAKERLGLLDRAARLRPPTAGHHQLRADALRAGGDAGGADEQARAAAGAPTAMDHFLRAEAMRHARGDAADRAWDPNRAGLEEAAAEYRRALRLDPGHYWSRFQLGRCLLSLGRGAEAVETLGACIALRPATPWGYNVRGLALGLLGRHAEARADLDRALGLAPEFLPARLNRGVVAWLAKDVPAALADFDAVLAAPGDRRLIEAAFYRAEIHLADGRHEEGLKELDRIVTSGRKVRLTQLLRARSLFHLGRDAEGLKALDAHLREFAPGLPLDGGRASGRRGQLLLDVAGRLPAPRNGQVLARARAELLRAVARGERTAAVFDDLGTVCEYQGDNDEAIKSYTLALEKDPKSVRTRVKRAWAHEKLTPPQLTRARDDFRAALAVKPDHAESHSGLGYILASLGNPADAARHANLAMLHGGGDYLILHNVACVYARLSQLEKEQRTRLETLAIDQLRRAVELWSRDRTGPDELRQIELEAAFSPQLRARPEFKDLFKGRVKF